MPAFAPPGASLGTAVGFLDEPMKCGAYVGMLRTIVILGGFTVDVATCDSRGEFEVSNRREQNKLGMAFP